MSKSLKGSRSNGVFKQHTHKKENSKTINASVLINAVRQYTRRSYIRLYSQYGRENIMQIIQYMGSDEFIYSFKPQGKKYNKEIVASCMRKSVANIVNEIVNGIVKHLAEKPEILENASVESRTETLSLLKDMKETTRDFISSEVDELMSEIMAKYGVKCQTPEMSVVEKFTQTSKSKILEQQNTADTESQNADNAEQKNTDYTEQRNTDATKEKAEEVGYYDAVKSITGDFGFLIKSRDISSIYAQNGHKQIKKFQNMQQYERYQELQKLVKTQMERNSASEERAIRTILNDIQTNKTQLKVADKKILIERIRVIEKNRKSVENGSNKER